MCTKSFSDRLWLHFQLFSTPFSVPLRLLFSCLFFVHFFYCTSVCINVYISMCRLLSLSLYFFHIFCDKFARSVHAVQQHSAPSPSASSTVCGKLEAKFSISIKFSNICSAWQRLVALFSYCSRAQHFRNNFPASLSLALALSRYVCLKCPAESRDYRMGYALSEIFNLVFPTFLIVLGQLVVRHTSPIFGSFFGCLLDSAASCCSCNIKQMCFPR